MGQFKPMVKMMTTEPTVELKLKKGGSVEKKMQMGGTPSVDAPRMPTRGGSASGEAMPGAAPMKPSMAARRRAMKARPGGAAPAAPVGRAAAVMKKGGGVKKMAMGGMPPRDIGTGGNPNPRRPLAQATDMPRPRPFPVRSGKMAAGGMPPRDIGTGAGPRRPLAQATDMPRPRPLPVRTGKMAAGGTPNDYVKGVLGNLTAPSTGGGGRRPLAQAIDRPRPVPIDKGYGNEMTPYFQDIKSQGVSASAPRRPLAQAIDMPRPRTPLPPRDIGTGGNPNKPFISGADYDKNYPRPMMKKGGKVHEDVAQDRAMIKKAMSGKKFATGGVVMGQGGYKTGGVIKGNGGGYKHGGGVKMYAKGGGVNGNVSTTPPGVSGTTTGSVKKSNGGGYKTGGAAKKFADGGAVQSDGRAVKMPQGNKRPSAPVSISRLSGTFKKGGSVKKC